MASRLRKWTFLIFAPRKYRHRPKVCDNRVPRKVRRRGCDASARVSDRRLGTFYGRRLRFGADEYRRRSAARRWKQCNCGSDDAARAREFGGRSPQVSEGVGGFAGGHSHRSSALYSQKILYLLYCILVINLLQNGAFQASTLSSIICGTESSGYRRCVQYWVEHGERECED